MQFSSADAKLCKVIRPFYSCPGVIFDFKKGANKQNNQRLMEMVEKIAVKRIIKRSVPGKK